MFIINYKKVVFLDLVQLMMEQDMILLMQHHVQPQWIILWHPLSVFTITQMDYLIIQIVALMRSNQLYWCLIEGSLLLKISNFYILIYLFSEMLARLVSVWSIHQIYHFRTQINPPIYLEKYTMLILSANCNLGHFHFIATALVVLF